MSEIRFNGRIRRAALHTEVTNCNDIIWISGFGGWRKIYLKESCLIDSLTRGISHESLHLTLRRRIGLGASKTLDAVLDNDFENVEYHGLCEEYIFLSEGEPFLADTNTQLNRRKKSTHQN